jgi:hypothetical protein
VKAAVVALAAALLVACQPGGSLPVHPAAVVEIGESRAAARVNNRTVEVLVLHRGQVSVVTFSTALPGRGAVRLLAYGGQELEAFNSFVYGTADRRISKVAVNMPGAIGGNVVDGAWLVALPQPDVLPDQIHWQMLDAAGAVRYEGVGITE